MSSEDLFLSYNRPFKVVLIFGPPGSGKGTQGKFLCSAGNHYHLSSGDIFRGLAPESSSGKLVQSYTGKGLLVPDEVTIQIWNRYVHGLIATNRYFPERQLLMLDGIPRTVRQVELLEPLVTIEKIIVLEVDNQEALIKRIQRRAVIEKRVDDLDAQVLRTRMEIYEQETAKLLHRYPERLIARFNASQGPLEVLRDILVLLSPLLSGCL